MIRDLNAEYFVAAQPVQRDGKRFAAVEVIDESECRNRWRINPIGKLRALDSLLKKPLLGPPEAGHEATEVVGHPVDFISNHATNVLYEIPDPKAWAEIESGRWGPVSPKLTILSSHDENGTLVLDAWEWDHVAFVPIGAFPNAGVKRTCLNDPGLCGFPTARAAVAGASARLDSTIGNLVGVPLGQYPQPEPRLSSFSEAIASLIPNNAGHFDSRQPSVGDLVGQPLGAWQDSKVRGQRVPIVIGATAWDTADAPDDCFALVPEAARGPRGDKSLRKLPLVSVETKEYDPVLVSNALTTFKNTGFLELTSGTGVSRDAVLQKICSVAQKLGIDDPLCTGMEWSRMVNVPPGRPVASAFNHFDPMRPTVGDLVGLPLGVSEETAEAASNSTPPTHRINGRFDPMQPTVGDLVGLPLVRGHTSGRANTEPDEIEIAVHPRRIRG